LERDIEEIKANESKLKVEIENSISKINE